MVEPLASTAPATLRRATLRFADPGVERAYQLDFFDRHVREFRLMGWCSLVTVLGVAPLDATLFPEVHEQLWRIRFGLLLPIVLLGLAMVSVPALIERVTRPRPQLMLTVVLVAVFAGLALLSMEILGTGRQHVFVYLGLGYMTAITALFVLMRGPFVYSTTLGIAALVLGLLSVIQIAQPTPGAVVMVGHMLALALLAGAIGGYFVELTDRRNFDLRRRTALAHAHGQELLRNIVPPSIASRIEAGERPIADQHDDVVIVSTDLVGFTALSASRPAAEIVTLLDELFSRFDDACDAHGAEKVKTLGDAYIAAVGLTQAIDRPIERAADLSLRLRDLTAVFSAESDVELGIRIGVHVGPVIAGVIGRSRVAYDVWGEGMQVAERMESLGEAGEIHVSDAVAQQLGERFVVEPRRLIGKAGAEVETAWLRQSM